MAMRLGAEPSFVSWIRQKPDLDKDRRYIMRLENHKASKTMRIAQEFSLGTQTLNQH